MPTFSPTLLLITAALLSAGVLAAAFLQRQLWHKRLRTLAQECGCQLQTPSNPGLASLILPHLPPGAADVRVTDVMTCRDADPLVVARVHYALGSVRQRRDNTRIVAFRPGPGGGIATLSFAALDLARLQQYRLLLEGAALLPDDHVESAVAAGDEHFNPQAGVKL